MYLVQIPNYIFRACTALVDNIIVMYLTQDITIVLSRFYLEASLQELKYDITSAYIIVIIILDL
jgi:hypothetical protein